ncbi:hypothetical protein GCM10011506_09130 [Marivirga lumbricoides]|uniref:DUF4374 domain-containing protein n=1 Tax=Marivirga lumbricoides TaxID=1046115 RepID=A0ABQ1LP82_9BACT|nr:hypothetical protein GCM10011506_09130 [Marivirga lumbricoides]
MITLNKMRSWAMAILVVSATAFVTACNNDDEVAPAGDYALSLAIQGSEGGFTYYTVPFADVMTGTLSAVGTGIEQPGYYDFTQFDRTIYSIGGLDDVNVVAITQGADDQLNQVGDVSFANSLSDIVKADDGTLVSVSISNDSEVVTFRKFNSNSIIVMDTVEHPVSLLTDKTGPSYSGMRISGDHLFLSYYISDPDDFATDYTNEASVAVFSYPELEFEKIITDSRVGPIGGFGVKSGLIEDENGNIYAVSHSNPANGYSQSTKPAGILKIKRGETEFDKEYFFDIEAATDGLNTAHLKYLGNGKAFAEINQEERDVQARWSDGPLKSAIVDLEAKTVNYIADVPEHAGLGRRLAALHDGNFVYTCIPEEEGIFVYRIDLQSLTATKGARVEANFVAGFFRF